MKHRLFMLCLLAVSLGLLVRPANAEPGGVPGGGGAQVFYPPSQAPITPPQPVPAVTPEQLQQQQQPVLEQQEQLQRDSGDEVLQNQTPPAIEQCATLLRQQWKTGGVVHFLSAKIMKGDPVYVGGSATFPAADGGHEVHHYRCYYSKDRSTVVSASIDKRVPN